MIKIILRSLIILILANQPNAESNVQIIKVWQQGDWEKAIALAHEGITDAELFEA